MEWIQVTQENLEQEHICCALADSTDIQVRSKKDWMAHNLANGLVFRKGNVRGKVFIEYIPAEHAWCPLEAPGYLFINCLWVAGKYKGQGNADALLQSCIRDGREQGRAGIAVLSSRKKTPYLSDPDFLRHKRFQVADHALGLYELLYLPLTDEAAVPRFGESVRHPAPNAKGFALYYTNQCPFTEKYVPLLSAAAQQHNIPLKIIRFETVQQAQQAPSPFTTYGLFHNGVFETGTILTEQAFLKLAAKKGYAVH